MHEARRARGHDHGEARVRFITASELSAKRGPKNPQKGERHWKARLTDAQVRQMRETWGGWRAEDSRLPPNDVHRRGYQAIAALYDCCWPTARDIVKGRTRVDAGGPMEACR